MGSNKQAEIIDKLQVKPKINAQEEVKRSIDLLKSYLISSHNNTLVLGISGGQDSTLAGKIAQLAVEEARKETGNDNYQFIAIRLPYGKQSDEKDAKAALEFIKPDQVMVVDIKPAVDAMVNSLEKNGINISDFNKGNIKARQRMIAQYGIAGAKKGLVVGTDHAAESLTGFYTKFGDGAADVIPLWRLDKRQGKQLLQYLKAPSFLYNKVPTADLEDNHPALPDEKALGLTYKEIDDYLENKPVNAQVKNKIESIYDHTAHKRNLPVNVFNY